MMKLNLKYIAASALTALALTSTATADDASERYVAENANAVLHTLNDEQISWWKAGSALNSLRDEAVA